MVDGDVITIRGVKPACYNGTFLKDPKNLRVTTVGEKLWLYRAHIGERQDQRAKEHGVGEKVYSACERDMRADIDITLPWRRVPRGLLCALARRRHGLSLRATAADAGISHTELLRREREGDERLVRHWKKLGYRF